jgi:hypothetical protein
VQRLTPDRAVPDPIHLSPFTIFSRAYTTCLARAATLRESKPRGSRRERDYTVRPEQSTPRPPPAAPFATRLCHFGSELRIGASPLPARCSMTPNRTICQCRAQRSSSSFTRFRARGSHTRIRMQRHIRYVYMDAHVCTYALCIYALRGGKLPRHPPSLSLAAFWIKDNETYYHGRRSPTITLRALCAIMHARCITLHVDARRNYLRELIGVSWCQRTRSSRSMKSQRRGERGENKTRE